MEGKEPVLCMLGMTGCGKSTFCHLIHGSDPRRVRTKFLAEDATESVTTKIEAHSGLQWFDGNGTVFLVF